MNEPKLQWYTPYEDPDGNLVEFTPKKQKVHDRFVIHYAGSYARLDQHLRTINASRLAYCLFYCLAADLTFPYGNRVSYNVKVLAARLDVSTAAIYDALTQLYYAQVALKQEKHVLLLDPYIVFAGRRDFLTTARKEWDMYTKPVVA